MKDTAASTVGRPLAGSPPIRVRTTPLTHHHSNAKPKARARTPNHAPRPRWAKRWLHGDQPRLTDKATPLSTSTQNPHQERQNQINHARPHVQAARALCNARADYPVQLVTTEHNNPLSASRKLKSNQPCMTDVQAAHGLHPARAGCPMACAQHVQAVPCNRSTLSSTSTHELHQEKRDQVDRA